jgi:hypothetical protein
VIAAWPSFALIASYELLMRQVRRAADATAARRPRPLARPAVGPPPTAGSEPAARRPATARHGDAGLQMQVQAWRWALANRADDGSLPSGKDIGLHHGRQEPWGGSSSDPDLPASCAHSVSAESCRGTRNAHSGRLTVMRAPLVGGFTAVFVACGHAGLPGSWLDRLHRPPERHCRRDAADLA